MKFKLLLYLLSIILIANLASAAILVTDYDCLDKDCTEGNLVNWSIKIHNEGSGWIDINTIKLVDPETKAVVASQLFNNITIGRDAKKTILIKSVLPKPNFLDVKLRYKVCIVTNVEITWRYLYGLKMESCEPEIYEMPDRPLLYRDCTADTNCYSDEICRNNKCIRFRCEECQYVANHMCVKYRCCESASCWENEKCVDNNCAKLACTDDEYISEHSCAKLNCSQDEFAYNHECLKLVCTDDEVAENHKCVKLDCKEDEFIYNQTCMQFECPFLRAPRNHVCAVSRPIVYTLVMILLLIIGLRITAFIINKRSEIKRYKKAAKQCPNCGTMLKPYATVCKACRFDLKKNKIKKVNSNG